MNGDPLREFLKDIELYRSVWRSARVSGSMTLADGHWISMGLRVSLSELVPEPFKIVRVYDWFCYFDGRCPIGDLERLADELVHGRYLTVPPDSRTAGSRMRVYLNRGAAQVLAGFREDAFQQRRTPNVPLGPTWQYAGFRMRGLLPSFFGSDRAGHALLANGERSIDLLGYGNLQKVDGKLRAGDPVFDGLGGLFRRLLPGLGPPIDGGEALFQIVAPLPFFLVRPEPGRLIVRAPAKTPRGGLGLTFFFRPEGLSPSRHLGLQYENAVPCDADAIEWTVDVPWPEGSSTGKACLFFLDREIDSLEMNRWPAGASLRAVFDDYFDPARTRLLQGLGFEPYPKREKNQQRRFETAVSRLMSLLGVPLIWFGDWLAADQRPDLGGLAQIDGKGVAILGECTLHGPEEKFSELHKRAEELAAKLGTEADVLAVVFTQAQATQSEAERAAEHGIALVGSDELRQLLDLLGHPEDPESVLTLLRELRNTSVWPLGSPPRFP